MQDSTFYAGMPVGRQQGSSNTLRSRLILLILPIIVIAISAGSLYGLQLASQHSVVLGYPIPQVRITTTYSSPVRLNDSVQFSAESSGRDLTYHWDFGDQTVANGPSVSHTFQSNGNFTVTVTVTDSINQTSYASTPVSVTPPPPVASFTWSPNYYYSVNFDASGSSVDPSTSITNYHWDFGDGTTDDTQSSQEYHNYSSTGTYTVTLTVTDGTGQQSQSYSTQVSVSY